MHATYVTCACGDQYPITSFGAGFMAANNGVCENCWAAEGRAGTQNDRMRMLLEEILSASSGLLPADLRQRIERALESLQ